jgi:hypothetical protein
MRFITSEFSFLDAERYSPAMGMITGEPAVNGFPYIRRKERLYE